MRGLPAGHGWLLAAGLCCMVLTGMGQALHGPALPVLARTYGLPTAEVGLMVAAHWVGGAAGIGLMFLTARGAPPRAGLVLIAAGAGLIAAGLGWGPTLLGAAGIGAGGAVIATSYNRRFLGAFGDRGPAMLALLNAVFGLGAIVGPLAWVALGRAPGPAYAGIAVVAVLLLPLARGDRGAPAAPAIPPEPALNGSVLREPVPPAPPAAPFRPRWGILAFGAVAIGLEASLAGLGPTALIALGDDETRAAGVMSAFFLAFLIGRLVLVAIAGRVPSFTLLALALAGTGLLSLAAALGAGAAAFAPAGFFVGIFFPAFFVAATRLMGGHPRVAPAIMAAGLAGGIAVPPLMTQGMAWGGDGILFSAAALLSLAAAAAALALLRGFNAAGRAAAQA